MQSIVSLLASSDIVSPSLYSLNIWRMISASVSSITILPFAIVYPYGNALFFFMPLQPFCEFQTACEREFYLSVCGDSRVAYYLVKEFFIEGGHFLAIGLYDVI